jgi:hypothetical protein
MSSPGWGIRGMLQYMPHRSPSSADIIFIIIFKWLLKDNLFWGEKNGSIIDFHSNKIKTVSPEKLHEIDWLIEPLSHFLIVGSVGSGA